MEGKVIYVLTGLLLLSFWVKGSEDIAFRQYTSNEGLVHNTVFGIGQDSEGFMWFATSTGLSRFDGKTFTNFIHNEKDTASFFDGEARQVTTDKNGNVWICGEGKIARFNKLRDNFEVYGKLNKGRLHIPYNVIRAYCDNNGNLWLCTQGGLMKFDYERTTFEECNDVAGMPTGALVRNIIQDRSGKYWIIKREGLFLYDSLSSLSAYRFIAVDKDHPNALSGNETMLEGPDGKIYATQFGYGFYSIDMKTFEVRHFVSGNGEGHLNSNMIRGACFDARGRLWLGTELGVNIFDPGSGKISVYKQDFNDKYSINDNAIYPVFKDRQDNMWLGTYFGGVNVSLEKGNRFKYFEAGPEPHFLSGKAISQIIEDHKGNLWIGTEDAGINYLDTKKETFKHYSASQENTLSYINVHSFRIDKRKKLWIGTYLGGLNVLDKGKFTYYHADGNHMPSNNVYALFSDDDDRIWVGTSGGLCFYDQEKDSFSRCKEPLGHAHIYEMIKSSDGIYWVGTMGHGLFFKEAESREFKSIGAPGYEANPPSRIIAITESSDGLIWIGTMNQGLYGFDRERKKIKRFTKADGLPDNTIYSIIEDDNNNLWMTTNNGLVRYYRSENYFRVFTTEDGLPNNQFNYKSGYRHSDGTIYFGSVNGMISFNPHDIKFNNTVPEIRIVGMSLFNEPVWAGDKNGLLSKAIFNTEKIDLKHDQNSIGFEFTAIDYTAPETNQFAYKMEGLEDAWNEVGNYNRASYSHLPPGEYTFRVKGCNNDGIWNDEGTSIAIIVHPPFWLSIWGYLLYASILVLAFAVYRKYASVRAAEKSALELERVEKEKIKELNRLKLRFYTNVSHEFRTPLSLIIDPLEKLAKKEFWNEKVTSTMQLVLKNACRLQMLVNQLLEFRKTETGQFKLKVSADDLNEFAKNTFDCFIPLAEKNRIEFKFESEDLPENIWFDKKIVDIVLYNLLSNALKFTPERGSVVLTISKAGGDFQSVRIQVVNSGRGIPEKDLVHIFDRFYQAEDHSSWTNGSGIGLALTKSLVEIHHGGIWVESQEGKGATFTVELPVDKHAFSKSEMEQRDYQSMEQEALIDQANEKFEEDDCFKIKKSTRILLVEDNVELRTYIKNSLVEKYTVYGAADGNEGWKMAREKQPDVIVSDVMMPGMNGLDLCRRVKTDINTSHIPVILLTARTSVNDKTEGLKLGADIYLEKPFNSNILHAHLHNLLQLRDRLKKRFESDIGLDVAEVTHSTKDEEFINRAFSIIFNHMSDPGFNVTQFIEKMAVSRSLLHLKLKEVTGMSASAFIQSVRIKEAAKLLKLNKQTISEIADQTGFSDPSYFSKCFKKHLMVSPKDYQKRYGELV
ncbi:MAG: response regulator [Cytophagales bacterium]|nr:response regulator [Cytophagales bacterium]